MKKHLLPILLLALLGCKSPGAKKQPAPKKIGASIQQAIFKDKLPAPQKTLSPISPKVFSALKISLSAKIQSATKAISPPQKKLGKIRWKGPGLISTLSGHSKFVESVAFSPDGRTLASGSYDNTIKLWDVSSGRLLRTLSGHSRSVWSVAFSPDGTTLASGSWDLTIKLWDVSSGRLLSTLFGHSNDVESVAFSPDGRTLASGSKDKTIKLWEVSSGKLLRTLSEDSDYVISVAFSPDGGTLASGSADKTIKLWDVSNSRLLSTLSGHSDAVYSVAFSPDGKTLASGSKDTIKLWDVSSGQLLSTLSGHSEYVGAVAFSPDGRILASSNDDKTIKLWRRYYELYFEGGGEMLAHEIFYFPGQKILEALDRRGKVHLFSSETGAHLAVIPSDSIQNIYLDGEVLYTLSKSGKITAYLLHSSPLDLSLQPLKAPPYARARLEFLSTDHLPAGGTFKLRLTIDNTGGRGPLQQFFASLNCPSHPSWNQLIPFGKIQPGKIASKEISLSTSPRWKDGAIPFTIRTAEANDYTTAPISSSVEIQALARPQFLLTTQIFDGQGQKGVGNGDGILQRGESPKCRIYIRNQGGAVGKGQISLSFPEEKGLQLFGQKTLSFSSFPSKHQMHFPFSFSVKRSYPKANINLRIFIQEEKFGTTTKKEISIPIGQATRARAMAIRRQLEVKYPSVPIYSGASKDTSVLGRLKKGTVVLAKGWLGDFYQMEVQLGSQKTVGWVETAKLGPPRRNFIGNTGTATAIVLSDSPPVVTIASPHDGSLTDQRNIIVSGVAGDDKGIREFIFYQNGREVARQKNSEKKHKVAFLQKIHLRNGSNKIEVVAVDTKGQKDSMKISVKYLGKYPILKNYYKKIWAVVIGIDRYKDKAIPTLKYAVADAKAIEHAFKTEVLAHSVKALYNEEATKENIQRLLQGELDRAEKGDAVFVYVSGHGMKIGENGYLIPYDGSLKKRYKNLSMATFKKEIASPLKAQHMLVVVDACYGGVLLRSVGIRKRNFSTYKKTAYLKQARAREAKLVMTAGSEGEQVLDAGGKGHSVFTSRLLEVLKGAKYFIGARELFGKTSWKVKEDAERANHAQTPQFGYWYGDGDFVLIKR